MTPDSSGFLPIMRRVSWMTRTRVESIERRTLPGMSVHEYRGRAIGNGAMLQQAMVAAPIDVAFVGERQHGRDNEATQFER